MVGLLIVVAILLALSGAESLTQATLGVGMICLGAVVAIIARIAQADRHDAEVRRLLAARTTAG
jgi:predicted benzoate:H+ symporter BenE